MPANTQTILLFLVPVLIAASLIAAPSEPVQKPVKLPGLGAGIDPEFAKASFRVVIGTNY